jgi:hypothetical protein
MILLFLANGMLSEVDLHLLDVIANFERIQKYNLYELWFTKNKKLTNEEINECARGKNAKFNSK